MQFDCCLNDRPARIKQDEQPRGRPKKQPLAERILAGSQPDSNPHPAQSLKEQGFTNGQNTCHPILPICHFTLKASKTALRLRKLVQMGFTMKPETLGQHLRSRRLALNLTQAQAAHHLNTLREQYDRWERDEVAPEISMWPRLIHFLGYYPAECQSPADWVLRARRTLGLTQFAIGRKVGIIAENIRKWEHGKAEPPQDLLHRFQEMGRVA